MSLLEVDRHWTTHQLAMEVKKGTFVIHHITKDIIRIQKIVSR
jgi:hypothetical protein